MIKITELLKKETDHFESMTNAFVPPIAVISLSQDCKTTLDPTVSIGDSVLEGQIIGKDSKKNACIHSPIPGTIIDIFNASMPNGKRVSSIAVKLNGSFSHLGKKRENASWLYTPTTQRIKHLSEMGVLNTFDKAVTLSHQIKELSKTDNGILAVRLFDRDPSNIAETFIAEKYVNEILEGTAIIADTLNIHSVVFLYSQNNWFIPQDTDVKLFFRSTPVNFIPVDTSTYPLANMREIETSVNRYYLKELKKKKEPIVLALDAYTSLSVYNAMVKNIPVIDRIIHITGDAIKKPGIYKVHIGTPIHNLFEECGGFIGEPAKIIINGLVKGVAVCDLNTPITKYVNSITVLSSKGFPDQRETTCIRCGRCHDVCPSLIHPEKIYNHYYSDIPLPEYYFKTLDSCAQCALCNAVCPSRLPLYQTINLVRSMR